MKLTKETVFSADLEGFSLPVRIWTDGEGLALSVEIEIEDKPTRVSAEKLERIVALLERIRHQSYLPAYWVCPEHGRYAWRSEGCPKCYPPTPETTEPAPAPATEGAAQ